MTDLTAAQANICKACGLLAGAAAPGKVTKRILLEVVEHLRVALAALEQVLGPDMPPPTARAEDVGI